MVNKSIFRFAARVGNAIGRRISLAQPGKKMSRKVDTEYRAFVGPRRDYDLVAGMSFNLLTTLGLREGHRLLDVGCGSLRVGRLLIPYLNPSNYVGIEPNEWLVRRGIKSEVGKDMVRIKSASFHFADSPDCLPPGDRFDFVLAQSVFSHCTPALMEKWFVGLRPRLKQGGVILGTFLKGDRDFFHPKGIGPEDYESDGWIYPKCPHYRRETVEKLVRESGYGFRVLNWNHPRQTWFLMFREGFDTAWLDSGPLTWNRRLNFILGNDE